MAQEHVINISPSGEVRAVHSDKFSLGFLGPQNIVRASDIRWDEESQSWGIWFNVGGEFVPPLPAYAGFSTYETVRKLEVRVMETAMLYGKSPVDPSIEAWAQAVR